MPESEAKKRWTRENTSFIGLKLAHKADSDILRWLDNQPSKQGAIRAVLKAHIAAEKAAADAAKASED